MSNQKHILVVRFSAMGDVALVAPVVRSFLHQYTDFQVTLVTRPKFSAFFYGIERLNCFQADVDKEFAGLFGLFNLFLRLKKEKPSVVIDLHDHLRSRFLCFLFRMVGVKIIRFKKGRSEKAALTRKDNKIRKVLPHTVERYQEAFARTGFTFKLLTPPFINVSAEAEQTIEQWLLSKQLQKKETWIGLAPFAAHKSKIWSLENYSTLIKLMKPSISFRFFLFGGGNREIDFLKKLVEEFPDQCVLVAGQLKLNEELALISKLDKMLCVDSSNMHLAALMGVSTVSIWGGTHPLAGFGQYGDHHTQIQVDINELLCRPCSVYGTKHCLRGDFACLTQIKPSMVAETFRR